MRSRQPFPPTGSLPAAAPYLRRPGADPAPLLEILPVVPLGPALLLALLVAAPAAQARPDADVQGLAVAAGEATGSAAPMTADDAEDNRALRRIVRLQGGTILRGIVRKNGGAWELKQGAAWQPIPADAVLGVELEKVVVNRFQDALRSAFRADDPLAARAKAVDQGLSEGVLQEAVDAAEVVLRDHPAHAPTRAVLHAHADLLGVPPVQRAADGSLDLEALFRFASPRARVQREVAVLRLDQATTAPADRDTLRAALGAQMREVLPGRRSFAALAQGRLFPGEEVRPLLVHAMRDASEAVRAEAARAVGAAQEPGLVLPLVKALDSPSPTMRRHAAEALGHMGYAAAVEPLVARLSALASAQSAGSHRVPHRHIFVGKQFAYIQDFDVEVAQLQSVADPQVNVLMEGEVLDAGVVGTIEYRHVVAAERASIQRALENITGERPGGRARDWIDWWEQREQ
jgi:hypothetical protein